jgi:hypothetical protein
LGRRPAAGNDRSSSYWLLPLDVIKEKGRTRHGVREAARAHCGDEREGRNGDDGLELEALPASDGREEGDDVLGGGWATECSEPRSNLGYVNRACPKKKSILFINKLFIKCRSSKKNLTQNLYKEKLSNISVKNC